MEKGTISKKTEKGFGFISREGQEKDLFFHANEVQGTTYDALREGDAVSFEVAKNEKGFYATNVQKA